RDPGLRRPHGGTAAHNGAHVGDPRLRRPAGGALRRARDGARDPRRRADDREGHGPRPAPRRVADADRRDLPARHTGGWRPPAPPAYPTPADLAAGGVGPSAAAWPPAAGRRPRGRACAPWLTVAGARTRPRRGAPGRAGGA